MVCDLSALGDCSTCHLRIQIIIVVIPKSSINWSRRIANSSHDNIRWIVIYWCGHDNIIILICYYGSRQFIFNPHRSKCLVNCFNAGPTISVMPFEGFPCVLKPPVNADLIGYNIGNIVTNHKTAFFVSTNHMIQNLLHTRRSRSRSRSTDQATYRALGCARAKNYRVLQTLGYCSTDIQSVIVSQ